jgi:hypothetical protein
MESMKELMAQLNHNCGNSLDKIHTIPIQSRDARTKRLLQNWKGHRAIEHTQQRVKFVEVAEATKLGE